MNFLPIGGELRISDDKKLSFNLVACFSPNLRGIAKQFGSDNLCYHTAIQVHFIVAFAFGFHIEIDRWENHRDGG